MSYLVDDLTLSTTLDNSQVQGNDAALDTAISGNLTELNFSSATRIPNSILASPNVEETIILSYDGPGRNLVWPAASTTVPIDILRIGGTATYTVLSADYTATIPTGGTGGGTTGSLRLDAGTLSGTNFASSTNLVAAVAMTNIAAAGQTVSGSLTLAGTSFTAPIHIAALSTLIGTTCLPLVRITIRVTRSLQ